MIKSIFIIIRPLNILITMASVYLGGIISFNGYFAHDLLLAIISAGALCGYGNVVNDIFDIDIDRRNKSTRPLPSGAMRTREAIFLAMILVFAGIVIAGLINNLCLLMASAAAIALLAYTPAFKGNGYWGNLLIGLIASLAFFYGAASVYSVEAGIIPAAFAFILHFGREVVKDMEDRDADSSAGLTTGAVKFGLKTSRIIAAVSLACLIAATVIPYLINIYGIGYLIVVIAGADIFLVYVIIRLAVSSSAGAFRTISIILKVIMPLGLLAVFLGSRGF